MKQINSCLLFMLFSFFRDSCKYDHLKFKMFDSIILIFVMY